MALTLKQRVYSGLWFMAAAVPPVAVVSQGIFAIEPPPDTFELVLKFVLSPLLIAGLCGALLGASILDPHKVKSGWRAGFRGFLVALAAYLLYSILISFWEAYTEQQLEFGNAFLRMFLGMWIVGLLVVGWLVVGAGIFAGVLLRLWQNYKKIKGA